MFRFAIGAASILSLATAVTEDGKKQAMAVGPTGDLTMVRRQSRKDEEEPCDDDEPAPQHTAQPTAEPTAPPTAQPTAQPTAEPTAPPTAQPTAQPTAEPTPRATLKQGQVYDCQSHLNLVLVIDGSGSIGSSGWDASIKTAETITKAFKISPTGSHGSIIVYSRYVDVLHHLTGDEDALLRGLQWAYWPRGTTNTADALEAAKHELANKDPSNKQSIVVLITDGIPNDKSKTTTAAEELKKDARLVIVPVTAGAPLDDIKKWASSPTDVLVVDNFNHLNSPDMINKLVSSTCASVSPGQQIK